MVHFVKSFIFLGWWIEYALDYCYVQNTYFLGFTELKPDNWFDIAEHIIPIPKNHTERDEKQLGKRKSQAINYKSFIFLSIIFFLTPNYKKQFVVCSLNSWLKM